MVSVFQSCGVFSPCCDLSWGRIVNTFPPRDFRCCFRVLANALDQIGNRGLEGFGDPQQGQSGPNTLPLHPPPLGLGISMENCHIAKAEAAVLPKLFQPLGQSLLEVLIVATQIFRISEYAMWNRTYSSA